MANPNEPPSEDLFEQIFGFPNFTDGSFAETNAALAPAPMMMLQLSSGDGAGHVAGFGGGGGTAGGGVSEPLFPLELSLEHGKEGLFKPQEGSGSEKRFHEEVVDSRASSFKSVFHGQPMPSPVAASPNPPVIRPRVRARRGQATDPHSIAERLRRERIAERIRALQELVPSVSKTDKAVMLDEIVDYVKFLRLQVKVLSMSRLGGAGAVAPLATDLPLSTVKDEPGEGVWEKWTNDKTEKQVAKLMEENIGAAMQLLQSKGLCVMPIPLATAIYDAQPPDVSS